MRACCQRDGEVSASRVNWTSQWLAQSPSFTLGADGMVGETNGGVPVCAAAWCGASALPLNRPEWAATQVKTAWLMCCYSGVVIRKSLVEGTSLDEDEKMP